MRTLTLIFVGLSFAFIANCQTVADTVYLNTKWEETSYDNAKYFRVIKQIKENDYQITDYWISGEKQMFGSYNSLKPLTRNGLFEWYYKNGTLKQKAQYRNNIQVGLVEMYNTYGNKDFEYVSNLDSLDNANEYRDCLNNFYKFARNNLRYPKQSRKKKIEGSVITVFFINKVGELEKLSIAKSLNNELDQEALRVINSYNNWSIPIYKGEKTNITFNLPINFKL